MNATKGYYSVIQYCPDASRMEAANIGVLLLCPDVGFVRARIADGNDRIRRFFRGQPIDLARVNAAKRAIEKRVEIDRANFRTPDDLIRFIETRGNDVVLTPPRSMRVLDAEAEIDQLFRELVGGRARKGRRQPEMPELDRIFRQPSLQSRVLFDQTFSVPVLNRPLRVPYAFHNGVLNLVKPQRFSAEVSRATSAAMRLAIEGDLLHRHPTGNEQHKLIVVSDFEQSESVVPLRQRVSKLFGEYHVRVVHSEQLTEFGREVESQAHF